MTAEHVNRLLPGFADDPGHVAVTVSRRVERELSDISPDDALTVVAVAGEIDEDTVSLVGSALARALNGPTSVCCDLSGVTFFGAAAARTLLAAHFLAVATGRIFFLRGVRGITARVLNAVDPGLIVPR
jgi:anti-anti-sigma factor